MAKKLKKVVALHEDDKSSGNADGLNALLESLGASGISKTLLDHNRYTTIAAVLAITLFAVVKGYQPTTIDPFHPLHRQTAATITAEHDQIVAGLKSQIEASKKRVADMGPRVELAAQQIATQEKEIGTLIGTVATVAAPFAGPFAPVVLALTGMVAAGFAADGARKASQVTASVDAAKAASDPPPDDPVKILNDNFPALAKALIDAAKSGKSK